MSIAAELEQRCDTLAAHLRSKQLAAEEEILECFDQDAAGDLKWAIIYADLRVLHAGRAELTDRRKPDNDQEVLAALSDEPATVTLGNRTLSVHPKSFAALQVISRIAERIDYLLSKMRELEDSGLALADDLYVRVDDEVLFLYRALVWGVTHKGPRLPFEDLRAVTTYPQWIVELSPIDIQRIRTAFLKVNAVRLALLVKMIRLESKGKEGPASSWATFFSMRSDDTHLPTPTLMRDHSLGSQMAAALVATSAKQQAMKEAETKRG